MNDSLLHNYDQLIERVDLLCRQIAAELGSRITCHAGCSSCCLPISIFPVEQAALQRWVGTLSNGERETMGKHLIRGDGPKFCPLLLDDRCLIYPVRPIICRTHGFPILYQQEDGRTVDCCPRNDLAGVELNGSCVIDLDRLNSLLVAINTLYCQQCGSADPGVRIAIADALRQLLVTPT